MKTIFAKYILASQKPSLNHLLMTPPALLSLSENKAAAAATTTEQRGFISCFVLSGFAQAGADAATGVI